jgi:hypothetical protein
MRTPNSRARAATATVITAYMPAAASPSATTANRPIRNRSRRVSLVVARTMSSIVDTVAIGCSGATAATAA